MYPTCFIAWSFYPSCLDESYRLGCGNHMDTARIAKEAGVKTLVCSHMLSTIDQPGVRERILKEMMEVFPGIIVWGEDLMEIPLAQPKKVAMG